MTVESRCVGGEGLVSRNLVVCAGGFGAKVSSRLPFAKGVVVIGSSIDIQHSPYDVTKLIVNVGSDTGAHRDHLAAYKQLSDKENLEKIKEVLTAISKTKMPPVVVYGLCGATGVSVARTILDSVPAINVVAMPHPNEPEAKDATSKFKFLTVANKFINSVIHAVTPTTEYDGETIEEAAEKVFKLTNKTYDFDTLVNHARNNYNTIDGRRVGIEGIREYVRNVANSSGCKYDLRASDANSGSANVEIDIKSDEDDRDLFELI